MGKKICSKCNIEKELLDFNKNKLSKDGYKPCCRECQKIESKIYKQKNKKKIKEQGKEYYINNKDRIIIVHADYLNRERVKILDYRKNYYKNNKEKHIIKQKIYREKNREKINKNKRRYQSERREKDSLYKLTENIRCRVKNYLDIKKITKKNKTFDIVGCTPKELSIFLEKKFKDGMTWDNYGFYGWHIDHIIPLSSAKTEEELYKLFHYTNLQPLWAFDNLSKGDKILSPLPNNTLHIV